MKKQLKFLGNLDQLMLIVTLTGTPGRWRQLTENHHQFRSTKGAFLNWWSTTKTLYLQGKAGALEELELAIFSAAEGLDASLPENFDIAARANALPSPSVEH